MMKPQIPLIYANQYHVIMDLVVHDTDQEYYKSNPNYPLQEEVYKIIGACMEVHSILGKGFREIIYKEALEHEFRLRGIPYEREKKFVVPYKKIIIQRPFYVDFFVYDEIILEAKAQNGVVDELYKQTINYLAASGKTIGLLVNFGEESLKYKRVIHTKNTRI